MGFGVGVFLLLALLLLWLRVGPAKDRLVSLLNNHFISLLLECAALMTVGAGTGLLDGLFLKCHVYSIRERYME